ncbi:MAG TPA: hypothetical protein VFW98_05690 [Gemmatimonadaceae bacterium]|nr:hypothetical protein [Gemmatimonadaceae bacterium]
MTIPEQTRLETTPLAGTLTPEGFRDPGEREPLADARVRPLLERYASAAGAQVIDVSHGLVELVVPPADRAAFRDRERIRIAFTVEALELDPDAEIAVVGSALLEQLVAAIRLRGSRVSYGLVPSDLPQSPEAAMLRTSVANGRAGIARVDVGRHRMVRLLARVIVRAGSAVEEHLVESGFLDASTGARVADAVAARCAAVISDDGGEPRSAAVEPGDQLPLHPGRPIDELVSLALADLRAVLEPRVLHLRQAAQLALQTELRRIDGYYTSLLHDAGGRGTDVPDANTRRVYEAEHARRRAEEERRHQVRAVVHPVQLTECEVVVQLAQWELIATNGHRGRLAAQRALVGDGAWAIACPQCGTASPATLSVCKSDHVACATCARVCGVCSEVFCWDHGIAACHVDGHPTCQEHARTCTSCREPYCTGHEERCADGEHSVCTACIDDCAICGRRVCRSHATVTTATAPRGARYLCHDCVRYCEGGANEPVGCDEVTRCASCDHWVCDAHRATCAVDGHVHCSKHLRRTDGSRRLVCESHRASCALEPAAILASDEVTPCADCGRTACNSHSHTCCEDGRSFCTEHSVPLRDKHGSYACRAHHAVCHVDGQTYSLGEATPCPVCNGKVCSRHRRQCAWCGREVCTDDFDAAKRQCRTCLHLAPTSEPSDSVLAAAVTILGSRPTPKNWKTARDAWHTVVEMDMGWTKRVVFVVPHGDTRATGGRSHSVLGSKSLAV